MQNNDETPQLPVPFTPPTSSYTQNISPYSNTDFNPYTSYEAPPFSQNVGGGYFSNNIAPYSQMPLNPTPQSNYAIPLQSYASVPLGSNSNAKRIGPRDFSTATYEAKQVQAVIVTIADHSSYDNLFHEIEQTAPNPEKEYVSVFSISSNSIESLLEYFRSNKELEDPVLKEMMKEITSIEGDCVVFNWECCGGCSSKAFPIAKKIIFQFVKELLDRKMLCMFSDFSLKALIAQWDSELLGPNPFIQVGEFSNSFNLAFVPQTLLDCPSAQLQKVGELCANGTATVGALGGTILYTVKPDYSNPSYELTILTVVTSHGGEGTVPRANDPNQPLCKIDALVTICPISFSS